MNQNHYMKMESDCNLRTCNKCGHAIEKNIDLLGVIRRVPIVCECKKKELQEKELKQLNTEKQIRLGQIINNSLMDKEFMKKTFENWDHKLGSEKIFKITKNYADNFKKMKTEKVGLIIYGDPGNGKTYSTAAIANELIKKFIPVTCVSVNSLLERIKLNYNTWGNEGEDAILKALDNAELLIIDDLGTEQPTEWSISKIYNIIDSRYRKGLPFIITTNVELDKLKARYHNRTYDRILEMCVPVLNDAKSIRADKAKHKTEVLKSILS